MGNCKARVREMDRWSTFALRAQSKREQRLVRKRGFEPPRSCDRQPLKLVRLPFRHFRVQRDE